jgi:hypothetical protein
MHERARMRATESAAACSGGSAATPLRARSSASHQLQPALTPESPPARTSIPVRVSHSANQAPRPSGHYRRGCVPASPGVTGPPSHPPALRVARGVVSNTPVAAARAQPATGTTARPCPWRAAPRRGPKRPRLRGGPSGRLPPPAPGAGARFRAGGSGPVPSLGPLGETNPPSGAPFGFGLEGNNGRPGLDRPRPKLEAASRCPGLLGPGCWD